MARKPREEVADGVFHVFARGVDRRALFVDDRDRELYLTMLGAEVVRRSWRLLQYCLMGNHVHLLVRAHATVVSRAIQDAHGGYARAFNDRHGRVGHMFDGRYKARPVLDDAHLQACLRYLAHNPVAASYCPTPADWSWSSQRALAGFADRHPCHLPDQTLLLLAATPELGRHAYLDVTRKP